MLNVGDEIELKEISDQHGKSHKLKENQTLVITWDRETTAIANNFFDGKSELFTDEKVAMIVDVSQTPEGIMTLFVMPRMKSFKHPILLSYDEAFNLTLPYKDEKITLLKVKEGKVEKIDFLNSQEELKQHVLNK